MTACQASECRYRCCSDQLHTQQWTAGFSSKQRAGRKSSQLRSSCGHARDSTGADASAPLPRAATACGSFQPESAGGGSVAGPETGARVRRVQVSDIRHCCASTTPGGRPCFHCPSLLAFNPAVGHVPCACSQALLVWRSGTCELNVLSCDCAYASTLSSAGPGCCLPITESMHPV